MGLDLHASGRDESFALTEDANRPVGTPHPVQQIPEKEHVDVCDIVEGDDGSLHFLIISAACLSWPYLNVKSFALASIFEVTYTAEHLTSEIEAIESIG
jgi:hypothetical protein